MIPTSTKASIFSKGMRKILDEPEKTVSLPKRSNFIRDPKLSKSVPKLSARELPQLTLYKNPLPAEPINVFKGPQQRHHTLEIFKKNIQAGKQYTPEKITKSKNGINNKINKNDSIGRVQYLFDRAKNDDDNNLYSKKSKVKGTMYINELWGHKYEEKTIRAASIHKELAEKEKSSWRPLQHRFENVTELFEKKHRNLIELTNLNQDERTPTHSVFGEESHQNDQRGRGRQLRFQIDSQDSPSPTSDYKMIRHSSLPQFDQNTYQETPDILNYPYIKNAWQNEVESTDITPNNNYNDSTAVNEFTPKKWKNAVSPQFSESANTSFSHQPSMFNPRHRSNLPLRLDLKSRSEKVSFTDLNSPKSAKHKRGKSQTEQTMPNESFRTKMFLNDKNLGLSRLISKCNDELDDRPEWLGVISNMQGLFLTPKYNKKIKHQEAHKQKMIDNYQDLLRMKIQSKKK